MNYRKISQELLKRNRVDKRMIMCHAFSNYTHTKNRLLFLEFEKIKNDYSLPYYLILSINKNYLHIAAAKLSGGYKKHFAVFKLSSLRFNKEITVDLMNVYIFDIVSEGNEGKQFKIMASINDDRVMKLVDAINEYNRNRS